MKHLDNDETRRVGQFVAAKLDAPMMNLIPELAAAYKCILDRGGVPLYSFVDFSYMHTIVRFWHPSLPKTPNGHIPPTYEAVVTRDEHGDVEKVEVQFP